MSPTRNPSLEDTLSKWLMQNADEIEKTYGVYIDESIADLIKQTFSSLFQAMKYQSDIIRSNEG